MTYTIPTKANRILNIILVAMVLIVMRIWHLAVVQYNQKLEESRKPQRKVIIEPATRATIRDRFNLPLAINKIQYQAAILYSQIQEIRSVVWEKDTKGKRVKRFKRKEYIKQLACLLAEELNLDAERLEDLIHSKAYYAQIPFAIKEELTEKEYYRLKMLAKDWPGIYVRRLPKRYYPRGRVAADVIGYMGAINRQEYEKILHEMSILEQFIREKEEGEDPEFPPGILSSADARKRLKDLEEKAYTIHDYVGKTGIEGAFEELLRGFYGKKIFCLDSKGNFLKELPGSRAPLSGHRLLLTISAELQEYAEQLLAQNEPLRLVKMSALGSAKQTVLALKHPWIKGGAIVVMDPQTGEVLTLASYPRFDPNDFIASGRSEINKEKKAHINRWFENESYLADIWDQQQPLERERYDDTLHQFYDEKRFLSWNAYLDFIVPVQGDLWKAIHLVSTLEKAILLQNEVEALCVLCETSSLYHILNLLYDGEGHIPYQINKMNASDRRTLEGHLNANQERVIEIKQKLDFYFNPLPQNYDKVLLVDLCRLAVANNRFSSKLIERIGRHTLAAYREEMGASVTLMTLVKEMSRGIYHDTDFKSWRQREEKKFLDHKRAEERAAKTYTRPYLDYLDRKENQLFQVFWEKYKWDFLLTLLRGRNWVNKSLSITIGEDLDPYLDYFDNWYKEIKRGAHQAVEWKKPYIILQKAIRQLPKSLAIQYLQTMRSYQELIRPLWGRYRYLRQSQSPLEKHLASAFYPVYGFGYGRSYAYRQAAIQGSIFKLVTAYEALVQNFKRLNKKNISFDDLNPLIIVDQVFRQGDIRYVGYTEDGKPIPQLYKGGRVPRSLAHQNNGKVDLIRALEVSSNPYFSLLAGEFLEKPEDLVQAARLFSYGSWTEIDLPGEISGKVPDDVAKNRTGLYALAIGQHSLVVTPLQTAIMLATFANGGKVLKPKIVNLTAGRQPTRREDQITYPPHFLYRDSLSLIGIDFPLFTAVSLQDEKSLVKSIPTEVKREIFMPQIVRQILLRGLRAATYRTHEESKASLTRLYQAYPEAMRCFSELRHDLLGKTSTSESVENIDLDLNEGTNLYTHVWFGSIAFQRSEQNKKVFLLKDEFGQPELVVVVYLHYGGYGKEAAPLAAQVVKKWRELKNKYTHPSSLDP